MYERVAWMRPVDTAILELLYSVPTLQLSAGNIATNIDYERNYVNKRCRKLADEGLLNREELGDPYYDITSEGVAVVDNDADPEELRSDYRMYRGKRTDEGWNKVTVNGEPLGPRTDLVKQEAPAFEWGYYGNGPLHLSVAMLADVVGDDKANTWRERFCRDLVSNFSDTWEMSAIEIKNYVEKHESGS